MKATTERDSAVCAVGRRHAHRRAALHDDTTVGIAETHTISSCRLDRIFRCGAKD
jgi:hypothetical protein